MHNPFFLQAIQSFFRGNLRDVLIYKKQYAIMTQLLLRPSRCASSKKNNPELQRSLERFSFDFSTPAQKIQQKRASTFIAHFSFFYSKGCSWLPSFSGKLGRRIFCSTWNKVLAKKYSKPHSAIHSHIVFYRNQPKRMCL